jgi:uncharacterized protein (DUF302 family)
MRYTFGKTLHVPFDEAVQRTVAALGSAGFGVLSDIDVRATLAKKLGLDVPPYRILGACNPLFASRALAMEPEIGTLLPCNVVVRELGSGQGVRVDFMDPAAVLTLVQRPDIAVIAAEVRAQLDQALVSL